MPISRRSIQRRIQKHVLNPGMRTAIRFGYVPRLFALLETTGRRTGLRRQTPVTVLADGGTVWLVAEQGLRADYVRNIAVQPRVRIKIGRSWHAGRAVPLPEDDAWSRHTLVAQGNGWLGRADGIFFKVTASSPVTVRVDLDG